MKNLARSMATLALFASGGVLAQQTETATISVNAEVVAGCGAVTATDVDFGAQPQTETDSTGQSTITVNCSTGTSYTVEINYGMTPQGTLRTVTGSGVGAAMDYYVWQDSNGTVPWGDIANTAEYNGTGTGAADPLTAYFVLDRTGGAAPDTYTDLLAVTLTF